MLADNAAVDLELQKMKAATLNDQQLKYCG
jgi:hypothetical protein